MTQARARSSRAAWVDRAPERGRRSPSVASGGGAGGQTTSFTPRTRQAVGASREAASDTCFSGAPAALPPLPIGARTATGLRALAASTSLCPACLTAACGPSGVCHACVRLLRDAVAQLPAPAGATLWLGPHAGILRRLVHALKYRGAYRLAPFLAELLLARLLLWQWQPDLIVHLPTTATRRRLRGYDQAQLLAAALSRQAHVPHRAALTRRAGRGKLVGQGRAARVANLSGAFRARGVNGLRLLLIDDVLTSGATLADARRAAAAAGATESRAAVVARTAPVHEESEDLAVALKLLAGQQEGAGSPGLAGSEGSYHGGQDAK